jgi:hypothetical protein
VNVIVPALVVIDVAAAANGSVRVRVLPDTAHGRDALSVAVVIPTQVTDPVIIPVVESQLGKVRTILPFVTTLPIGMNVTVN